MGLRDVVGNGFNTKIKDLIGSIVADYTVEAYRLATDGDFNKAIELRDIAKNLPDVVRGMKKYDAMLYLLSLLPDDTEEQYIELDSEEDTIL